MLSDTWGIAIHHLHLRSEGALSSANEGLGPHLGLVPASIQGLQTSPAQSSTSQGMAVETDPLGRVTTYTFDSLGQPRGSRRPTAASRPGSATSPASRPSPPMRWAG